jgi:hypothetical protein
MRPVRNPPAAKPALRKAGGHGTRIYADTSLAVTPQTTTQMSTQGSQGERRKDCPEWSMRRTPRGGISVTEG